MKEGDENRIQVMRINVEIRYVMNDVIYHEKRELKSEFAYGIRIVSVR